MIKKKIFVLQSELTQKIDNLISYFENEISKGGMKIDKLDIKEFESLIGDEDILVRSELHYLRDFMNLEKVDMIHLDSLIERLIKKYKSLDPAIFEPFHMENLKQLSIYKVWQTVNNIFDTYDSAVVVAESKEEARRISPSGKINSNYGIDDGTIFYKFEPDCNEYYCGTWVGKEEDVNVEYLGKAKEGATKGVLLASFNAG